MPAPRMTVELDSEVSEAAEKTRERSPFVVIFAEEWECCELHVHVGKVYVQGALTTSYKQASVPSST